MIRGILLALTLAACASPGGEPPIGKRLATERAEEGVKHMQDEFNSAFPDG